MRNRLHIVLLTAALATVLIAPASAEASHRCRAAGSTTVLTNEFGRVFTDRVRVGSRRATIAFGCLNRTGRAYPLISARELRALPLGTTFRFGNVRLNARYVGYSAVFCLRRRCRTASVAVIDLLNGRSAAAPSTKRRSRANRVDVTDLELSSAGSLAWIGFHDPAASSLSSTREVYALDPAGFRLLNRDPDIEPQSLSLPSNAEVTWLNDGERRSAKIF